MIGCFKATELEDGSIFASMKPEHTQGPEVGLVTGLTSIKAFVCLRCRLVYVPEEICDG